MLRGHLLLNTVERQEMAAIEEQGCTLDIHKGFSHETETDPSAKSW